MNDERVTCECGRWRWAGAVDGWVEQYHHRHIAVRGHESFYCWRCHTELFCDAAGNPVARAMIPADETLAESIARQQADPAKGGLAAVVGKWPGDESDAEIEEALAAMKAEAMVPLAAVMHEVEERYLYHQAADIMGPEDKGGAAACCYLKKRIAALAASG